MQRIIGLMSGTSFDGVDAAGIVTDGETVQAFGPGITVSYPTDLRNKIREVMFRAPDLPKDDPEVKNLATEITKWHVLAARTLNWPCELIGFHGQTIFHNPPFETRQIGDPQLLADACRCPVAYDFRSDDLKEGGQGAPLVPLFLQSLFEKEKKPLALLNIGGVANITFLGEKGEIGAGDTGPGCALIDDFMLIKTGQACDFDGEAAQKGQVQAALLAKWLRHPYFARPFPKSLDRLAFVEYLKDMPGLSTEDGVATLSQLTVAGIKQGLSFFYPSPQTSLASANSSGQKLTLIVSGGGVKNAFFLSRLREIFRVIRADEVGLNADMLEAQCFGFLAARTQKGLPITLPSTTGVKKPLTGGKIIFPRT